MKVKKVVPEVIYKLELTSEEYSDIKSIFYWARSDTDYSATEQSRYEAIYQSFRSNA